jgi:hypothetical protein
MLSLADSVFDWDSADQKKEKERDRALEVPFPLQIPDWSAYIYICGR